MSNLVLKKGALDRCCGALDRLTCRAEAAILLLEEAFSFRVPLFTSSFSFPRALPSHRSAACLTKWDEPMVGTKRQKGSISMRQLRFLVTFIMALLLLVGLVELVRPGPVAHASSGTWSPTGSMSTPRSGHTATRLKNGKVLVAGGLDESGGDLTSAELYDPSTGTWSKTGSMSTARDSNTAIRLKNGKVLVVGGLGSSFTVLASAELYTP